MSQATDTSAGIPHAYQVHPLLDPKLPSNQPGVAKMWITAYRRLRNDPEGSARYLSRAYSFDPGGADETLRTLERYCHDADYYIDDLLRLLPGRFGDSLRVSPATRETCNIRDLFIASFEEDDPRRRYEAQRKLYLAKLLYDVDHCRSVRDGPQHRKHFEGLLEEALWSNAEDGEEVEICCVMRRDAEGVEHLDVGVPPGEASMCWKYNVRMVPGRHGRAPIRVYHFNTRFKRDATPTPDRAGSASGLWRLDETPRWPGLGRRSGSIVSKMIRRGIDDPSLVQDILGAMFIVENRNDAYALERRLIHALGGPFRWRDRVDALAGGHDRERLGAQSASEFRVLKQIVYILHEDPHHSVPYLFSVEVQIFPVEDYLRTLYDSYFASHTSYKRRQFLKELLPLLFPAEVYGEEVNLIPTLAERNGTLKLE